jgi:hypothetical protein
MDLAPLARRVRPQKSIPELHHRLAEVTAWSDGEASIKLAGSSIELTNIVCMIPVYIGDIVWVAEQGSSLVVMSKDGISRWPNVSENSSTATSARAAGASGVWPSSAQLVVPFRKYYDDTQVLYTINFSCYATGTGSFNFGLNFGSGVHFSFPAFHNDANVHQAFSVVRRHTGLAAGLYSVGLEAAGGSAAINADANDYTSVWLMEIPLPQTT